MPVIPQPISLLQTGAESTRRVPQWNLLIVTRQKKKTEKEMGRHYQGMDRPGVRKALEGSGEQRIKNGGNWSCPDDPRG